MITVKNLRTGEIVNYIGIFGDAGSKTCDCLWETCYKHAIFDDFPVTFEGSGTDANGDVWAVFKLPKWAEVLPIHWAN